MSENKQEFRRIQIRVTPEMKAAHDRLFRWGEWNRFATELIEWLIEAHAKMGDGVFLLFRKGDISSIIRKIQAVEGRENGNDS